jgi:hypothetical protein
MKFTLTSMMKSQISGGMRAAMMIATAKINMSDMNSPFKVDCSRACLEK